MASKVKVAKVLVEITVVMAVMSALIAFLSSAVWLFVAICFPPFGIWTAVKLTFSVVWAISWVYAVLDAWDSGWTGIG